MANLALLDLVLPYVLRAENLGPVHAALSTLRVVTFETGADAAGVTLRGHCEVNGSLEFFPASGALVSGAVDEAAPAHDPSRSDPVLDLRDTAVDFELYVPRQASGIVTAAEPQFAGPAPNPTAVLDALAPTDYPSTGFTLDLVLDAPTLRPPFLHPARLVGDTLAPDTSVREVAITLPRMRLRVQHGNAVGSQLVLSFASAGVSGLDDPGSPLAAELVSMSPPYAFVGGADSRTIGIGFRSATLDLDDDWTPPALREKAGVGDDWTGLYLPEARVFLATTGGRSLAFELGVHELLVGVGRTSGVWGDFEAAVVARGATEVRLSPRFDVQGRSVPVTLLGAQEAEVYLPDRSTLVVDVSGGRAPYRRRVAFDGTVLPQAVMYDVDLSATPSVEIGIEVRTGDTPDGSAPDARMVVHARRLADQPRLEVPGRPTTTDQAARITSEAGLDFDLDLGSGDTVTLRTVPPRDGLVWKEGATALATGAALATSIAGGVTRTLTAEEAGTSGSQELDFYFFFDSPGPGRSPECRTRPAVSKTQNTWSAGAADPVTAYAAQLAALPTGTTLVVEGDASYENKPGRKAQDCALAWRRASTVQAMLAAAHPGRFQYDVRPHLADPQAPTVAEQDAWAADVGWTSHVEPHDREHWAATITVSVTTPATTGTVTVERPPPSTTPGTPVVIPPPDPPPATVEPPPAWFRSAKALFRMVDSQPIAVQLDMEIDLQTMAEDRLQGRMGPGTPPALPRGRTLSRGTPVGPDNPADGITAMRFLLQSDPATGTWRAQLTIGADPADTDGLYHWGWIPQLDAMPASKDLALTILGSYLSFWPLLAQLPPVDAVRDAAEGRDGAIVPAVLSAAALAVPAGVAALPWFAIERVILFGGEVLQVQRDGQFTTSVLVDVEMDWSVDLLDLVTIRRDRPLKVRYKAIGVQLTNDADDPDGGKRWDFTPVFDSSRGYTVDVGGGGMEIGDPLGKILRVTGARLSRSNPMTLEVDVNLAVDLGVVSVDQASVRAYLEGGRPPELTALSASVDIPGALVGSGYMRIGSSADGLVKTIGGQLDLTLRPVNVRVAAALEIATITEAGTGRTATGVYVGLDVVLPVGIPLGATGLGIFGFRGIFGMHYRRTEIGGGSAPALEWLKASQGQPHLLRAPNGGPVLWEPRIDSWAFGVGILIGTMEGGVLVNLDGTFLLELPGPRVVIMMKARILTPPPSMDGMGDTVGVLAVIEITPEHFLIGVVVEWSVEDLVKIVIPVEAVFPFGSHADEWHVYLGARAPYGPSVEVDVLGIVKGTGYLMFRGDGIGSYDNGHATLPEIRGFGVALGVAAGFTWGSTDAGLYLRVSGGMDVVVGFDPFTLAGNIWVAGELRLFIISIGADASLTVVVAEKDGDLHLYVKGEACGHVDFFFFEVSGCVTIEIAGPEQTAPVPPLVERVHLQARSPALAQGTGVDRGIDVSLGDATASASYPGDAGVPVVPIDAVPVISMTLPASPAGAVTVGGLGTPLVAAPGVGPGDWAERGADHYAYKITAVRLERVKGNGQVDPQTVTGTHKPVVWWTRGGATDANPAAQLALLTWDAAPATKAIEYTDKLVEDVTHRWGRVCTPAADPAEVLWTFKLEDLGPSPTGWELEGVAWPDPPGTQRSSSPDTTLHVSEPWRTGSTAADASYGVAPAVVVGGAVPCRRHVAPRPDHLDVDGLVTVAGRAALHRDDPVRHLVTTGAEPMRVEVSTRFHDKATEAMPALRDLAAADHVSTGASTLVGWHGDEPALPAGATRLDLSLALQKALLPVAADRRASAVRTCPVKWLSSPVPWAVGDERAVGDAPPRSRTVRLETGAIAEGGVLVAARRDLITQVGAWALTAEEKLVDRTQVDPGAVLGNGGVLPDPWTRPDGPWAGDVEDLRRWAEQRELAIAWLPLPGGREVDHVDLALVEWGFTPRRGDPDQQGSTPSWLLGAVSTVSYAEKDRRDWDDQQISQDRSTFVHAVNQPPSDNALLVPDSRYRIVVDWTATRQGDGETGGGSETYWFKTDAIRAAVTGPGAEPGLAFGDSGGDVPVRLDPWVLVTLPDDGETAVFGAERLRLVFNTQDVDRLFTEHGKELRLRLEAANGQHPEPTPATPHPVPITTATLDPVQALLKPPWVEAAEAMLEQAPPVGDAWCVAADGTAFTHSELSVALPLFPQMGYLMDVELVPAGAAADARGPRVFRRHFTTGRYGTLAGLAFSVQSVRPGARYAPAGTFSSLWTALGPRPEGAGIDDHLRAHQLEPLPVPDEPRVVVFWEQSGGGTPQPAAVLVDATEPLARSRTYPRKLVDTSTPDHAQRWVLEQREWLRLRSGGDATVTGISYAPGLQRAFVVLAPGMRGTHLTLDLVALGMPDLTFLSPADEVHRAVDVLLDRAPWEEV